MITLVGLLRVACMVLRGLEYRPTAHTSEQHTPCMEAQQQRVVWGSCRSTVSGGTTSWRCMSHKPCVLRGCSDPPQCDMCTLPGKPCSNLNKSRADAPSGHHPFMPLGSHTLGLCGASNLHATRGSRWWATCTQMLKKGARVVEVVVEWGCSRSNCVCNQCAENAIHVAATHGNSVVQGTTWLLQKAWRCDWHGVYPKGARILCRCYGLAKAARCYEVVHACMHAALRQRWQPRRHRRSDSAGRS